MARTPVSKLERIAEILVETTTTAGKPGEVDEQVAKRHGIQRRTIRNYRNRLDHDEELARIFQEKRAKVADSWAEDLPHAIKAGIQFLQRAHNELDPKDPDSVRSAAGSLKILTDVAATWKILDARFAGQNRKPREPDRPVATQGSPTRPTELN